MSWERAEQAAKRAASEARVKGLQRQLAAERRAHGHTLRSLEQARTTKVKAAPHSRRGRWTTGDITEMIFSDVHGNQHEPAAVAALLGDMELIKPDRIFIGGDFINCGGFLAEHHTLGYVAETEDSYEEDVASANGLLDAIQRASGGCETDYLEGNHEWRVERWALTQKLAHHKDVRMLRRAFAPEFVLGLKRRGIRYYSQGEDHGCGVPGWVKRDKLFYVHKISNSVDAAEVALRKSGGNIAYFDTHRGAYKPKNIPGVGLFAAWNPGCLCKRQPLYMHTNPTSWTHGYLLRFINKRTGSFQMVNVLIDEGTSYVGARLARPAAK
jgi:hypothetical protein